MVLFQSVNLLLDLLEQFVAFDELRNCSRGPRGFAALPTTPSYEPSLICICLVTFLLH
jgi:hypothetical protein